MVPQWTVARPGAKQISRVGVARNERTQPVFPGDLLFDRPVAGGLRARSRSRCYKAASCVDGSRLARVFLRDEQWSLAVMCPAF